MNRFLASTIPALALWSCAHVCAAADTVVVRPLDLKGDRYVDATTIRSLPIGARVELQKTEAGWVQVRIDGQTGWVRASGLTGDAASVAALSRLESGRSASGNLVVAAGIRGIRKASRHALIIGADALVAPEAVARSDDVAAYRLIAQRIGVPTDHVDVVEGEAASLAGIVAALDRLADRVRGGDQVVVAFTGTALPGDAADCAARWSSSDGKAVSASLLWQRLRPAVPAVDKWLFLSQTSRDGRASASPSKCASPAAIELRIVDEGLRAGVREPNVVSMETSLASAPAADRRGVDGSFIRLLTDCFLGDAVDADRSGSISIDEIATCVDTGRSSRVVVRGNGAWSPIVGVVVATGAAAAAATSPRAALDAVFAQRDGRIDVALSATPTTLRIGQDFVDLALTSSRAGFVYLVLLGSDGGDFHLLFPNDLDRDNRIDAGRTLRLPRASWRVQAQGPAGRDTILAIVAESERDLGVLGGRKDGPFGTALADADGRARLQWVLGRSGRGEAAPCVESGTRRNLAVVAGCSDAFGAALLEIVERP